ncbi:MAG: wax ester/triacylglycerol synthase domain-containing protein, partial [Streptomyces sp.]
MCEKCAHSRDLNGLETLMWQAEADGCRFDAVLIGVLDRSPDWEHLQELYGHLSLCFPRMRQRVSEVSGPWSQPVWVEDPEFAVTRHLRRMRVPGHGELRDLLDLVGRMTQSPLDRAKPLWSLVLVEGLRGGEAAVVLRIHHAVTDGMGLWWALQAVLSRSRDASLAPVPSRATATPSRATATMARSRPCQPTGLPLHLMEGPAFAVAHVER